MIIKCNCKECGKSIGTVQFSDYYDCKSHYGEYVCIKCYENGNKKCEQCMSNLHFHSSNEDEKFEKGNNLMH